MSIHPPAYPLSREAFKRALTTGHGRALLHANHFGATEYREEILEAATTCLVYDSQIDGSREWWLAQLCKAAGLVETIIHLSPDDSERNRELRACLLKEFCLGGYPSALPQLYAMCRQYENSNGMSELIEVEGEKGLIFAARCLGEALLEDPDFWVGDWELWRYDDLHGKGSGKAVLSQAAIEDPVIRHYLQEVAAYEAEHGKKEMAKESETLETVEEVVSLIRSSEKREGHLRRWGRNATPEDRAEVAKLLKTETRTFPLINALWCLVGTGLPEFDETMLGLVFHEDEVVRFRAAQMFSQHSEPPVRKAGLALLNSKDLALGLTLLRLSALNGDSEQIICALEIAPCVADDCHDVVSNLVQLLESNDAIQEPLIPLFVYEHSPCMLCRERAVEVLLKWGKCPEWVMVEAVLDASENIRVLAGAALK